MLIKDTYSYIFVYVNISIIIVLVLYLLSYILSEKLGTLHKLSVYECGFEPINSSQVKFNIKFYIVALLFVIFDLEIIFLLPWSINLINLGLIGYYTMFLFFILLTIGFIYEYKKGAIEW